MDLKDLGRIADYLIRCGLNIKVNPSADFVEAMDTQGSVHLYYPEKQLAVFSRGNGSEAEKRSVENLPLNKFAYVCKHPEALRW